MTIKLLQRLEPIHQSYFAIAIIVLTLVLVSIGTIMNTSASLDFSQYRFGDNLYFLKRQLFYLFLSASIAYLVMQIPMTFWYQAAPYIAVVSLVLLIIVLIPTIGLKANGARRWLSLGFITMQVSEFVKIAFCLYLSSYLVRHQKSLNSFWTSIIKPAIILSGLSALLLLQPDFGSIIILTFIMFGLLYFSNVKFHYLFIFILVAIATLTILLVYEPYRLRRLTAMLEPWADQFNVGYQLTQSLIAIGQGQWLGVGLGNSVQKLFFLPEAHTDFIFAIIAEELGFIGATAILVLMTTWVFLVLKLADRIQKNPMTYYKRIDLQKRIDIARFSALICFGTATLFFFQMFVNVAMTLGMVPTKGLTLPFISYGGSSLLSMSILVGLVVRAANEFNQLERGNVSQ